MTDERLFDEYQRCMAAYKGQPVSFEKWARSRLGEAKAAAILKDRDPVTGACTHCGRGGWPITQKE